MRHNTTGRLSLVISVLALVVAMAGTSVAAVLIGTNQLKNNAVTSPKIKDGNVTGKDVKESTLSKVPSAAKADSAANATKVNGATIVTVNHRSGNVTDQPVGTLNGLTIRVTCTAGVEALSAVTTVGGGEISYSSLEPDNLAQAGGDINDDFLVGTPFQMPSTPGNASDRTYRVHYSAADNKSVTAFLATEDNIDANNCIVSGYLIG